MLELKDIVFSVNIKDEKNNDQKIDIIKGINFKFEKGKFYAITGPNGSGKTTLAKLIMGINRQTGGNIFFEDKDITELSITERAKLGISYSFQHPARFKGITFRDLLAISSQTDDEEKLLSIVRRMGICPLSFLDKPVDATLSGGEIKKIELATTIARNPKLAIYDEPDTGIDLWTIMPMVTLLKKEQKDKGTTTIVVSHNKSFFEVADTILILNGGNIVYEGNLEKALPILADFRICNFRPCKKGETDARCYR
ncbi:MAG TPA: ATP-binding cassette domain-containing protein [Smithellaceae bacterium]|jgi:Fe-S cluster assembly ATP-binding protein|nr:ATP-binding cassette domain-containing protein [Syntrophaceae bacterium]HOZ61738.1 ATP-binding cassette domain-containing protein [Smithellaceae bacterium]